MTGFTKLFSSITTSSIWGEDDKTRIVWITMLALCEADGIVRASVGGLAHAARVSREDCEKALNVLLSPDPDSRSLADEGRRISRVDGGFTVNNHAKYRDARSADERKEYMREYMRKRRATKGKANGKQRVNLPLATLAHSEAEAEADIEAKASTPKAPKGASDDLPKTRQVEPDFPDDLPESHRAPLKLWWQHKRQIGKGYKPIGWQQLIAEHRAKPAEALAAAVAYSIANNYQGLFTPRPEQNGQHRPPSRPCDISDVNPLNMREL